MNGDAGTENGMNMVERMDRSRRKGRMEESDKTERGHDFGDCLLFVFRGKGKGKGRGGWRQTTTTRVKGGKKDTREEERRVDASHRHGIERDKGQEGVYAVMAGEVDNNGWMEGKGGELTLKGVKKVEFRRG